MPHPTLEACSPTIMRHQLSNNALEEDSMETAKEYFEGGKEFRLVDLYSKFSP